MSLPDAANVRKWRKTLAYGLAREADHGEPSSTNGREAVENRFLSIESCGSDVTHLTRTRDQSADVGIEKKTEAMGGARHKGPKPKVTKSTVPSGIKGNETALTNSEVRGMSYALANQMPVTYDLSGKWEKCDQPTIKPIWIMIDEAFRAAKLIKFLQFLIKFANK